MSTGPTGRPQGRVPYWTAFALAQVVRVGWSVRIQGREHLRPGPVILVGNHVRALDPVFLGISLPRRLAFVTKAEAFAGPAGPLLRRTGQILIVRGDPDSTAGSLAAAAAALEAGHTVVIYPEATRSPDGRSLHRLHPRVLGQLVQDTPSAPVHAVAIGYARRSWRRPRVHLRISPALAADPATGPTSETRSAGPAIVDRVRDALLALGGMPYVDRYGSAVKAARRRGNRG